MQDPDEPLEAPMADDENFGGEDSNDAEFDSEDLFGDEDSDDESHAQQSNPGSVPQGRTLDPTPVPHPDQVQVDGQAAQPSPGPQAPLAKSPPGMTQREQNLWGMNSDQLFQQAKRYGFGSSKFGKGKSQSRKSGRISILRWILKKEGITPYAAPRETAIAATDGNTAPRRKNKNGATDHPEAILQTSDPALQQQIYDAKQKYLGWNQTALVTLAMQRSYQLFKDSEGKMPTRAKAPLAQWLAAWDVLKSPREKRWWLGDGIDLVNKAKAMGYDGESTKKYDIIVWLRSTPEDAEVWTAHVAPPSATVPPKRKADGAPVPPPASKRPAKGSHRPPGWKRGFNKLLEKKKK